MIRKLLTLTLLLSVFGLQAQEKFTVSGSIKDGNSGETLIGATVYELHSRSGTTTNAYGFYSLTLEGQDSIRLQFSYIGFQDQVKTLYLDKDTQVNIELSSGIELEEIVVKANSFEEKLKSTEMSVEVITTKEALLVPVAFGESDILKTLQLKPGIPSGSEGTTGLFVRGGGSDQNLIVLDEAVVYNANHLFGFFSTFNTDAVKNLKLYKGGFPAEYGGRLSSVIDVKLKDGNSKKFAGSGGLGIISSRLTLEGPIVKDKSSFIISGRRTYFDIITRQINKGNKGKEDYNPIPDYYFYDLNTKVNYSLSDKDKLYLSGYFGRDVFGFDGGFFVFDFDWGNATGTARWNHVFNPKLFSNTTFTYSNYQYNIQNKLSGFKFNIGSEITDASLKTDFLYAPTDNHTLKFGAMVTDHTFNIRQVDGGSDDGSVSFSGGTQLEGVEAGLYVSDLWKISEKSELNWGLRASSFFYDNTQYFGLEPRIAFRHTLSDNMSLKGSYARMRQHLHLIAAAGSSLPTDVWYPSTSGIKPQISDQAAVGVSYLLDKGVFVSFETYYKYLQNQLEFVDGADIFGATELEPEMAIGEGDAYGFEVSIEKKEGKLTGWIGYTLAKTTRKNFVPIEPNRNIQSEAFAPIYDRRHDVSVVAIYQLSPRFTLSGTFVYGSGDLRWMPSGRMVYQDVYGAQAQTIVPDYGPRNTYRMPAYIRMDLGLVWKFFPAWGESDLSFNIINATDRRNAFFIYFEPEYGDTDINGTQLQIPEKISAKQVSLFPILPAVTWNFKF